MKENSDVESNENSSESGEESGEEIEVEGFEIEIEGQAEEIVESGGEIEGEEIEGEESEGEGQGQAKEIEPDTIDSTGPVGPDGSGPVGGSAGSLGAAVPAISLLQPTPVKNKGKGKATSDDNQEDMLQNKPDFNPDSLMVDNELGRLKRGREHSGTGEVRGSKTQRRSVSHSTAPTVPPTEDDDLDDVGDLDDMDDVGDIDDINPQGSSRSTGGFSRGRAMGNHFNWGDGNLDNWGDEDANADPADWNRPTRGKVLLFVNR